MTSDQPHATSHQPPGIVALAGGVGAARLLDGLIRVVDPASVTVIGNVGDDAELFGLHVSPDLDIVTYTLAGLVDDRGWGLAGDTQAVVGALARFGYPDWFGLGDRDLATCLHRTNLLRAGRTLAEATDDIRRAFGLACRIIPATDDPLRTMVDTDEGELAFQDYFVRRRTAPRVKSIRFAGADRARPAPGVIAAIEAAERILFCPSNPFVSIGTILAVPGVRAAIAARRGGRVAVSPIVGGAAIKGPAADMLTTLGHEVSALGIARIYRGLIDSLIIDEADRDLAPAIEDVGIRVVATDTIMRDAAVKQALAAVMLAAA